MRGIKRLCTILELSVKSSCKCLILLGWVRHFSLDRIREKVEFCTYMAKDHTVTVYQNADNHKLLHDLYMITRKQIEGLRRKVEEEDDLTQKDLKTLDLCYDGLKKLIGIEKELKTDALASMTDDELRALARKTLREGLASSKKP